MTQAAENSAVHSAAALGKLVSGLIVFIVAMMAMGQLKIDTEMVRLMTSFVLAAGTLAFGLAFELGTRDVRIIEHIAPSEHAYPSGRTLVVRPW